MPTLGFLLAFNSSELKEFLGFTVIVIIVLLFVVGGIWVIATLEQRVEKYIRKKALLKEFTILSMRDNTSRDGKNPFGNIDVWIGVSSRIFGFKGERVYNKIVTVKKSSTVYDDYWVKVKTSFFVPSSIKWKKMD